MDESDEDEIEQLAGELGKLFGSPAETPARADMSSLDIGSVSTTSVHADADALEWLAQQTSGDQTLYADTVELDTNRGTFIFDTDGDSVTVDFEPEDTDD